MEINLNEQAKAFFLYAYFGIVSERLYDEITNDLCKENPEKKEELSYEVFVITKCVERAYLDFCRTLKFSEKYKGDSNEKQRKNCLFNIYVSLAKCIREMQQDENKGFGEWHNGTCDNLIREMNNFVEEFHYGQAQKWINMTLKYMWLLGLIPDEIIDKLHFPVDRYLIEAVWPDCIVPMKSGKDKNKDTFNSDIFKPWSIWDETEYNAFRDSLQNNKSESSLSWENEEWISTAAKHSIGEFLFRFNDIKTV